MRYTYTTGDRPLDGYTIQHDLGRGGFGEVYQATSDGGKQVALKLVQRNLDVELRGVNQCLNLKHANLVSVHDVREADTGEQWIVMEYIQGETLDKVVARHPQGMPQGELLRWLTGIGAGVGYLHDHGIVHRDLKPGNTFLEGDCVKIGDYGLSKFISTSRCSGQTTSIGTVHYMAPEIANGRYGKEVDLYAMGVMLYEMLTGRVPFTGASPGEIIMKHLTSTPDLREVPAAFRPVVARLLDKDPYRRYSSAQALLADLNGYLSRPAEEGIEPTWMLAQSPAPAGEESTARPSVPVRSQPEELGRSGSAGASWAQLAAEGAWGWIFTTAMLLGVGAACFVGIVMYNPNAYTDGSNNLGASLAWAIGTGTSVCGVILLFMLFFRWAGKFADPDTVRKFRELERHSPPPFPSQRPLPRQSPALAVLGKVALALLIGAGIGGISGGATVVWAKDERVANFGWVLGCSIAMIVFAGTAFGWLFDKPQEPRGKKRKASVSLKETPSSRSELPRETGPWPSQPAR